MPQDEHNSKVQRSLGRIEGKLDMVLPLVEAHSAQLAKLEKSRNVLYGGGAVIVAVLGAGVKALFSRHS